MVNNKKSTKNKIPSNPPIFNNATPSNDFTNLQLLLQQQNQLLALNEAAMRQQEKVNMQYFNCNI